MATITQVLESLASVVDSVVYPNGDSQPSIINVPVSIMAGWPVKNVLDQMLENETIVISVYGDNNERSTMKFLPVWFENGKTESTLKFSSVGDTVTFAGNPTAGDNVFVSIGNVNAHLALTVGITLATIAQYFATQFDGTASGNSFTVPGATFINVRIAVKSKMHMEVKRQTLTIRVMIWAPSPVLRDELADILEPELGNLDRFVLPDNFYAGIQHGKNILMDRWELKDIYRQDLVYLVDYPSTLEQDAYTITQVETILDPNATTFMLQVQATGFVDLLAGSYSQGLADYTISGPNDIYRVTIKVSDQVGMIIAADSNFDCSRGKGYSLSQSNLTTTAQIQAAIRSVYIGYFPRPGGSIVVEVKGKNAFGRSVYYVREL